MNDQVYNSYNLDGVCAALCSLMGIEAPEKANEGNPALLSMKNRICGRNFDRILMYNPDAVALWLYQKYSSYYIPVQERTSLTLPLACVMPSVAPVCFGTMYTGAQPEVHGIQSYTKPVIRIETIFDAMIKAGKKPAIVSTANDSISCIFLEREMDYFIYPTVDEVNEKAMELIKNDEHDLIVIYNGNYDSTMHRWAPEGEDSLKALKANMDAFAMFFDACKENWAHHDTLIGFAPDHGCHEINGGLGSHGLYMPEDINILHFYGAIGKVK